MTLHSKGIKDLITRNYGLRLVKGRRQMILPSSVLAAFVEHEVFLTFYDPHLSVEKTNPSEV